jgi:cell fate regulator YaaT (PSP1 superfamily)
MDRSYLIRYGLTGAVGQFAAAPDQALERGQTVVVRSHRGTELGEVLIETPAHVNGETARSEGPYILRAAAEEDLDRGRAAERSRAAHFAACSRIFENGLWPIDLIDVEVLLDGERTVVHYLGPHNLDIAGVLAALRAETQFDVMFQPVGRDVSDEELNPDLALESEYALARHSCGEGCGSGAGAGGGCGSSKGEACASCGVQKLLASRR